MSSSNRMGSQSSMRPLAPARPGLHLSWQEDSSSSAPHRKNTSTACIECRKRRHLLVGIIALSDHSSGVYPVRLAFVGTLTTSLTRRDGLTVSAEIQENPGKDWSSEVNITL